MNTHSAGRQRRQPGSLTANKFVRLGSVWPPGAHRSRWSRLRSRLQNRRGLKSRKRAILRRVGGLCCVGRVAGVDSGAMSKAEEYRQLRALGLSQRQIAARAGVSRSTVRDALGDGQPATTNELRRDDGTPVPCNYCGAASVVIDKIRRGISASGDEIAELRVPSCAECKSLLSRDKTRLLSARKEIVKAKLRDLYSKELRCPDWTERQLAELSADFRAFVMQSVNRKAEVKDRLAW